MEHILKELVGTRTAAPEYPDIGFGPRQPPVGSSFDYSLSSSQKRAIHRVSCPSDWRGFAYLSGQNSFFDLSLKPSPSTYREAEFLFKTEPISPMVDQPEVPKLNEGEEDAANANPNEVNINAEDIPLNNQNNMAEGGVQGGGQLSSITLFSGTKGLEALTFWVWVGYGYWVWISCQEHE